MEARQRDAERDIRRLIGWSDGPLSRRSVENSRLVIAAVFIVLLLIGEAALFAHAVKTMPDFLSQADVQVP